MNLSEHFTLEDLTFDMDAIKNGVNNKPTDEHLKSLIVLCENVLQPLQDELGLNMVILSGYKGAGVKSDKYTDKHATLGESVSFTLLDTDFLTQAFHIIESNTEFDRLIWEFGDDEKPKWITVSYSDGNNRGLVLKSKANGDGSVSYTTIANAGVNTTPAPKPKKSTAKKNAGKKSAK